MVQHLTQNWMRGITHVLSNEREIPFQFAVWPITSASLLTFRLCLQRTGDLTKTLKLSEQIGLALGTDAPRLARNKQFVDVQVPLPSQFKTTLTADRLYRRGGTKVAIGQTPVGRQVNLNLSEPGACHALVAGITGSGKTVLLRLLTWSLITGSPVRNTRLIVVDTKGGRKFTGFDRAPHMLHPIVTDPGEAVRVFAWALAEKNRRQKTGRKSPRIFIVVDEVKDLLDLAGEELVDIITPLVSMGREFGIHLILATQKPLSDSIGGSFVKANMPLRLTGTVVNAGEAFIASGSKGSGAEALQGKGDFVINAQGCRSARVQVALITDAQIEKTIPRVERAADFGLDLGIDPARVANVNGGGGLDVGHVATALAHDEGINKLKSRLNIGGVKATNVRRFAVELRAELARIGLQISRSPVPRSHGVSSTAD